MLLEDRQFLARTRGAYGDVHSPLDRLVNVGIYLRIGYTRYGVLSKNGGIFSSPRLESRIHEITYKWQTAVCAHADLWFVGVDEYSGVSQWSTASITLNNPVVCPSYRLLVNQRDSCLRSWLHGSQQITDGKYRNAKRSFHLVLTAVRIPRTWNSMIVCSNLGPDIALVLGF